MISISLVATKIPQNACIPGGVGCVHSDLSNEEMFIRVQVYDCAAYNEYCNLMNLDKLSLALSCIMSFRTRYGKFEKVLNFEDYSFIIGRSE